MTDAESGPFRLGRDPLTPVRLATLLDEPAARLVLEPGAADRLDEGFRALESAMARAAEGGPPVYGATTGFGGNAVSPGEASDDVAPAEELQLRLARYLDTGSGEPLPHRTARGVLVARAHVLARGASGVRSEVVLRLVDLFHAGIAPVIHRYGSLGASGDLVSLAPLARLVGGEEVECLASPEPGDPPRISPGRAALARAGIAPIELRGRDTLALVNGLSGVATLAALLLVQARNLVSWSVAGAAATGWALGARSEAWGPDVNGPPHRRHRGQEQVAAALRGWVSGSTPVGRHPGAGLQDPYALRCVPQLLAPGQELLELFDGWLAAELDGVSDNPVPGGVPGDYLSGGNFFGGYVAQAADGTAGVLARMGDLLERQTFLLVDGRRGLPANLVPPGLPPLRHGLKGVHQAASALAMELQRGALPAAPFARSAEGHNQDVVSNAMNAATSLADQVDRAAALVAAHAALAAQAAELRSEPAGLPLLAWHAAVRRHVPFVHDDTPLREPLQALATFLRHGPAESARG
ncbi:MAG: aromatic amino acid lyase [Gemmatimonadales bacterium]|nr:MAG: aromatic amino acid lyase [Gemmatimonadales bacterium]